MTTQESSLEDHGSVPLGCPSLASLRQEDVVSLQTSIFPYEILHFAGPWVALSYINTAMQASKKPLL